MTAARVRYALSRRCWRLALLLAAREASGAGAQPGACLRPRQPARLPGGGDQARLSDLERLGDGRELRRAPDVRRRGRVHRHGRQVARALERALPARVRARLRLGARRRAHTRSTSPAPAPAASPPFAIDSPAAAVRRRRCTTRCRSTRTSATAPTSSARRSARPPAHLNDEHAQTYLTPKVDDNGAFKGDLTARCTTSSTPPAAGGTPATT